MCRTRIMDDMYGDSNPDARGNLAFNNINLPMIALESGKDIVKFWSLLKDTVTLAIDQLHERYKIVSKLKKNDLPFVSQWYKGSDTEDETISSMIKHGTLSVGYLGLAECLIYLTGFHHGENKQSQELGLTIIKCMKRMIDNAKDELKLNYSLFATPSESACHTLLVATRNKFGIIKGVTDKEYFTNGNHVPVYFKTDAINKIEVEAPYHSYTNAGNILYVECDGSPAKNPKGAEAIIVKMAKSGALYGGINWEQAHCNDCHHNGDFIGACPQCGSENIKVTAIITGYLSEKSRFNVGKKAELNGRESSC